MFQPHVRQRDTGDDLGTYIEGIAKGGPHTYRTVTAADCTADRMVPVTLASDVNLRLFLYDDDEVVTLTQASIVDWKALKDGLKAVLVQNGPDRERVRMRLDDATKAAVLAVAAAAPPPTDPEKSILINVLQKLIDDSGFYESTAFAAYRGQANIAPYLVPPMSSRRQMQFQRALLGEMLPGALAPVTPTTGVRELVNRRATSPVLANGVLFTAANRAASIRSMDQSWPTKAQQNAVDDAAHLTSGVAFVAQYNEKLLAALVELRLREPATASERIADLLTLAFWGNGARLAPDGALSAIDDKAIMFVDGTRLSGARGISKAKLTNLHSLNGLAFRVARDSDKSDWARILNTISFDLLLEMPANNVKVVAGPGRGSTEANSLHAYLASMATASTLKIAKVIQGTIDTDQWNRHIDVLDVWTTFEPIGGGAFRRSRPLVGTAHQMQGLDTLRALTIQRDPPVPGAPGTPPPKPLPAPAPFLELEPRATYHVAIEPYRSAIASKGRVLVRMVPRADERGTFFDEFSDPRWATAIIVTKGVDLKIEKDPNRKNESDPDLEVVGTFHLPWDDDALPIDALPDTVAPSITLPRTTVVFLAKEAVVGEAIVQFRRLSAANDVIKLTANLRVRHDANNAKVALASDMRVYWDATLPVLPKVSFDTLVLLDPRDDATSYVVATTHPHDVTFQLAQGTTRFLSEFSVSYTGISFQVPSSGPCAPSAVTPDDDHANDFINYNLLSVDGTWGMDHAGPSAKLEIHVNPWGNVAPVRPDTPTGANRYPFAHSFEPNSPALEVRQHLADVHDLVGQQRRLRFTLSHTYGIEHTTATAELASYFDRPPVLPADVPDQRALPNTMTSDDRLLVVAVQVSAAGRTSYSLRIRPAVLQLPKDPEKEKYAYARYVAGWSAIIEIARAASVHVELHGVRFDVATAFASTATAMGAGMKPVPQLPKLLDAAKLVQQAKLLLATATDKINPAEITLDTLVIPKEIAAECHLLSFRLVVERKAAGIPPLNPTKPWLVMREVAEPDRAADLGRKAENTGKTFDAELTTFLTGLATGTCPLPLAFAGNGSAKETHERVLMAVGHGSALDDHSWFAPDEDVVPRGAVVPAVLPIGIAPVATNGPFGVDTERALRAYFVALQALVDCAFVGWKERSAGQWAKHFGDLEAQTRSQANASFGTLFEKVAKELVRPIPNPDFAKLDPEIKELLAQWTGVPGIAFQAWVTRQMWRRPAIFNEAKAFLYTRLKPVTGANSATPTKKVSPDLFQLTSVKLIKPVPPANCGPGITPTLKPVIDADKYSYRDTLPSTRDGVWIGVAEMLDDARYEARFSFQELDLPTSESILDQARKPGASTSPLLTPTTWVPVYHDELHLPRDAQKLKDGRAIGAIVEVELTSRYTVRTPVHVFTGKIDRLQPGATALSVGSPWDFEKLRRGHLSPAAGPDGARLLSHTSTPASLPREESYVLSALFIVRGDEEPGIEGFANDRFLVNFSMLADPSTPPQIRNETASTVIESVFAESLENLDNAKLEKLFSPPVLTLVAGAIKPYAPSPPKDAPMPDEDASFRLTADPCSVAFQSVSGKPVDVMLLKLPKAPSVKPAVAKIQAKQGDPVVQPEDNAYAVVISHEVDVWSTHGLSLRQVRNATVGVAAADAESISPVFMQISAPSRDVHEHREIRTVDLSKEKAVKKINRISYSLQGLFDEVLRPFTLGATPRFRFAGEALNDLSVTCSVRQGVSLPHVTSGNTVSWSQDLQTYFPLVNHVFKAGASRTTPHDWFLSPGTMYSFDFVWSTPDTNLIFFRLDHVLVELKK